MPAERQARRAVLFPDAELLIMRKSLIFLIVLVSLSVPAGAGAHRAHAVSRTAPVTLAYDQALAYWRVAPCQGHVARHFGRVDRAWEDHTGVTPLSWASYNRDDQSPEDPRLFTDCTVWLNVAYWTPAEIRENGSELCVAMIHELGNLLGLSEVEEPPGGTSNPMNYYISEVEPPVQCRSRATVG